MFAEQVVPRLRGLGWVDRVFVHRKISLFGRGESDIEAEALDLTARGHVPEVGITVHDATISFRIRGEGLTAEEAWRQTDETAALIRQRFGPLVLGEGTTDVADALVAELTRTGATLATAESCTGGLVAHLVTAIPNVSPYYPGRRRQLFQPGQDRAAGRAGRADRGPRRGQPGGRRRDGAGRSRRFNADVAVSMTGDRRARREEAPRSPSAWCTSAWRPATWPNPAASKWAPNSPATSSRAGRPNRPSTGSG